MQWQQTQTMAIRFERNQTTIMELLPVVFENAQQGLPNHFRDGAFDTKLDDTWKSRSPQGEYPGEIKILSDDDGFVAGCVIEKRFIGIAWVSNIPPMDSSDNEVGEKIFPARREVFIDDQGHDASSSWISTAAMSAANAKAARIDSRVR